MKYIQKTSTLITEDFFMNLMYDRGILKREEDYDKSILYPTKENLLDPEGFDHIQEAYELLKKHLNNKIYLLIDPDVDGFTSAAATYLYLKNLNPDINITYHVPEGKEHGLEVVCEELCLSKQYDLIICPDSSSNDYDYHKKLHEVGYDILVLDHHNAEKYSENAIVINNQLSKNYSNKNLSGVGVVFKFFQYFDKMENLNYSEELYDLTALGQIGDMMVLTNPENRYITQQGLKNVSNGFFRELIEKQAFSLGSVSELKPLGIAFYIVPLINALIRVGAITEKERLFLSFVDPYRVVASTKRGEKGETEYLAVQSARNCVNARSRQNREKEKAGELLDIQIIENGLDDNKILFLMGDDLEISSTLTGLVAMGVSAKYNKPTMLGKLCPDGYIKGSIRGRGESELKDFQTFLRDSNLMDYVEGHANSAGFSIKKANVSKLLAYANKQLELVNFHEGFYEVDFILNGNSTKLKELIFDLEKGKFLWGQNCSEPLIVSRYIPIEKKQFQIIGTNKDTIKFEYNNIVYIKFHAKELIKRINELNDKGTYLLEVIGKGNINCWNGGETPQILIEDLNIEDDNGF